MNAQENQVIPSLTILTPMTYRPLKSNVNGTLTVLLVYTGVLEQSARAIDVNVATTARDIMVVYLMKQRLWG